MRQPYYYGLVELGDAITIWVQVATSADLPEAPDAAPTATIYTDAGTVVSAYNGTSMTQTNSQTGFYRLSVTASSGNGFESGKNYTVRFFWEISTADRVATGTFTVV